MCVCVCVCIVPQEWCLSDDIWIPNEMQSKGITNFRPISLLNVEGNSCLPYDNLSGEQSLYEYICTEGWDLGFTGCFEHSQMIWNSILPAKRNKTELHVIWFDFANAYGSVQHHLIQIALDFFNFPRKVGKIIMKFSLHEIYC